MNGVEVSDEDEQGFVLPDAIDGAQTSVLVIYTNMLQYTQS